MVWFFMSKNSRFRGLARFGLEARFWIGSCFPFRLYNVSVGGLIEGPSCCWKLNFPIFFKLVLQHDVPHRVRENYIVYRLAVLYKLTIFLVWRNDFFYRTQSNVSHQQWFIFCFKTLFGFFCLNSVNHG